VADHPNPRAWVLRVAWNYHRSSWRSWEGRWSAGLVGPTPPTPEPWVDPDLVAAIRGLPQGQREVIVLVALGELTPAQVARVLGTAAGTVRSLKEPGEGLLHQVVDRLRVLHAGSDHPPDQGVSARSFWSWIPEAFMAWTPVVAGSCVIPQ
jgi:DNA-directed RNA polymerase specialized sigma24 family protein